MFLNTLVCAILEELPAADELRRIPVVKPEALVTTDPEFDDRAFGSARTSRVPR